MTRMELPETLSLLDKAIAYTDGCWPRLVMILRRDQRPEQLAEATNLAREYFEKYKSPD